MTRFEFIKAAHGKIENIVWILRKDVFIHSIWPPISLALDAPCREWVLNQKIRLKEKNKNNEGFIDVLFEKNTFTLKKWIVFTNKVNKTEVLLENIKLNVNIQNKIFQIDQSDPRPPIWRDY